MYKHTYLHTEPTFALGTEKCFVFPQIHTLGQTLPNSHRSGIFVLDMVVPTSTIASTHGYICSSIVPGCFLGSPQGRLLTSEDLKLGTTGKREYVAFVFLGLGYLAQHKLLLV